MKARSVFKPGDENYSVEPSFKMVGKSLYGFNELFQIVIFHGAILRRLAYENVFSMLRNCQVQSAFFSRRLYACPLHTGSPVNSFSGWSV
ncbi:MAG: hypothetical protein IPP71_00445 [Bacteroidetes bacterium]|nr:hypothetical protein [Bacteroidota bacterium]